jgi:glyoxylase-like metal-dependent hydrolase (beta-lactamase superfamily II)
MMAVSALVACVGLRTPPPDPAHPTVAPVTTRVFGDVKVHALLTGWVRVKTAHRDLHGPLATRVLAIITDPRWTPWMPVMSYAIEHPDGLFLVDTGLTEDMLDHEHFACDPGNAFVYRNLLQFQFAPEDRIDARLAQVGLDVTRVSAVVLTHRHADHTDGLRLVPSTARIFVGRGDWPTHNGALACRWPAGREPVLVDDDRRAGFGALPSSLPLSADETLRVVPLPGHSPGHLGVMLQTPEGFVLFAGDALFDLDQLAERRLAGIVEVPERALDSLERIRAQLEAAPTFLLPAHDPQALVRFGEGRASRLSER